MAAKQLWEGAIVPSLLSGAGTWIGITPESEAMCEDLQELFWLVMFRVSKSGPKVMLTAETVSMRMKQRIWKEKLTTARSILLQDDSMAKQIYEQQLAMGWPGLAREVESICKNVGLDNLNTRMLCKEEIKEAIFYSNYKEMKEEMKRYKKMEDVQHEDFTKLPDYIMKEKSIDRVRIRSKMVNDIKMNFKKSYKTNLRCEWCDSGEEESQCHVTVCSGWEEKGGSALAED